MRFSGGAVSKLGLQASELNRRESVHGVTAYSLMPGIIKTAIWDNQPCCILHLISCLFLTCGCLFPRVKSIEAGAATQTVCAVAAGVELNGGAFFDDCVARPHKRSAEVQQKRTALFDATDKWLGIEQAQNQPTRGSGDDSAQSSDTSARTTLV